MLASLALRKRDESNPHPLSVSFYFCDFPVALRPFSRSVAGRAITVMGMAPLKFVGAWLRLQTCWASLSFLSISFLARLVSNHEAF